MRGGESRDGQPTWKSLESVVDLGVGAQDVAEIPPGFPCPHEAARRMYSANVAAKRGDCGLVEGRPHPYAVPKSPGKHNHHPQSSELIMTASGARSMNKVVTKRAMKK